MTPMNSPSVPLIEVLGALVKTCRDGREGFQLASSEVENLALKPLLQEYALQRAAFLGELDRLAQEFCEGDWNVDDVRGSGPLGWQKLQTALAEGDKLAILVECEREEEIAASRYREALHTHLPEPVREVLMGQFEAVLAAQARLKAVREAAAHLAAEV